MQLPRLDFLSISDYVDICIKVELTISCHTCDSNEHRDVEHCI